jgi:phosphate ABC transporter permease protein PstC
VTGTIRQDVERAGKVLRGTPRRDWGQLLVTRLIQMSGYSAIVFVALIFFFLVREGLPAVFQVPLGHLFSARWYPIEGYFGVLPLITGSLIVTAGAMAVAIPFGIATAVFISEIAPRWAREILKPSVELLGGLPSVVLGFLGILLLSPFLRQFLDLPTGLTALAGSLLLGGIAVPTIVSIAEDALDAVPKAYREAALALGATRWQTIWGVTLPAARSGVMTAIMLGIGRAIGETMAVMMVTGNAPVLALRLASIVSPVRTMTATIAAEMGEVATGSQHYHVLFFIGMVLFLISFIVNIIASAVVFRQRTRAERVLS